MTRMKTLAFSLALSATMAHGASARAFIASSKPTTATRTPMADKAANQVMESDFYCNVKGTNIEFTTPAGTKRVQIRLKEKEIILDSACIQDRAFVLTDMSLLVVTSATDDEKKNITLRAKNDRVDLKEIYGRGFVAWTQTHDTVYFLTRNRKLSVLSLDERNPVPPSYNVPFSVDGTKIKAFNGMLFVATGDGDVMVYSPKDNMDGMYLPISGQVDFSIKDGKLFVVKNGEEKEVKFNGPGPDGVILIR